jgi:hypothetical protein
VQRQLVGLPGGQRRALRKLERVRRRGRVEAVAHRHDGRACLRIPAPELRKVHARRILHRLHEIVAGNGHAVVTLEVEIGATAEPIGAEQGVLHADQLRTFLVHRARVEIVDFLVLVRTHVVRHRPRILGILLAAQELDGGDALDGARRQVAREFLVAKHGEAFLQR